jgi:hypothetical protein
MSDEGLNRYARDLAAEVDEAGAVYSEEEFTRLVLDKLGDEGVLENKTNRTSTALWFRPRSSR